jgi:hypothetical protein
MILYIYIFIFFALYSILLLFLQILEFKVGLKFKFGY